MNRSPPSSKEEEEEEENEVELSPSAIVNNSINMSLRSPTERNSQRRLTWSYQPVEPNVSSSVDDAQSGASILRNGDALSSSSAAATTDNHFHCWPFFALGLLNNAPYVVMLAAAKTVAEGGVGLVYLANIAPGLIVKASLPYWIDSVSCTTRLRVASVTMALAFALVGIFSSMATMEEEETTQTNDLEEDRNFMAMALLMGQLLGVALISFQCALGEASLLAQAGALDGSGRVLTFFSSGTGLAGPFGYTYKILLTEGFGWSLPSACGLAAILLPSAYYGTYWNATKATATPTETQFTAIPSQDDNDSNEETDEYRDAPENGDRLRLSSSSGLENGHGSRGEGSIEHFDDEHSTLEPRHHGNETHRKIRSETNTASNEMSGKDRFWFVLSLWPYIIPLFTVYAAEYACQGGVWTAMGLQDHNGFESGSNVTSVDARAQFYERSNWLYQAGVFVSRSSGHCFSLSLTWLWILPGFQVANLIVFGLVATQRVSWLNRWLYRPVPLYTMATWTGLLGGAVYVHGYQRILRDYAMALPGRKELALAATSMAESLGILVANLASLVLQSCLYEINDLDGALVTCPWNENNHR